MYTSFEIANFRQFELLKLSGLRRVNIIAGRNGSGKTSVLEALWLHGGVRNAELAVRIDALRGLQGFLVRNLSEATVLPWSSLFRTFDASKPIEIQSTDVNDQERYQKIGLLRDPHELRRIFTESNLADVPSSVQSQQPIRVLRLEYREGTETGVSDLVVAADGIKSTPQILSHIETVFLASRFRPLIQETTERFSNLVRAGKRELLLRHARTLAPDLLSMEVLDYGGQSVIHCARDASSPIPILFMGDGFSRLVDIILSISSAQNGAVLIDEIENGIHYSVLPDFWRGIFEAAQTFNTQIFATTHSMECVEAAWKASASSQQDFRFMRLSRRRDGTIEVIGYDRDSVGDAIEMNIEVR